MTNNIVFSSDYKFYKKHLYWILFFLLLTPSFKLFPFLPSFRLEEVTLLVVSFTIFVNLVNDNEIKLAWSLRQLLLLGFLFIIALSIFIGAILGFDASMADFNQFIRIIKYFLIYSIGLTFFKLSPNPNEEKHTFLKYYLYLSTILFFVCLQQYFNLFSLNNIYIQYIAPSQYSTLINDYPFPRPVGLVGNPNELAMIFVFGSLIAVFLLVKKFQLSIFLIACIQVGGVFITLSRGALVAFGVGLIVLFIKILLDNINEINLLSIIRFITLLILSTGILIFVVYYTSFVNDIFWRFARLSNLSEDTSWQSRILNWKENFNLFKESPLLGVGPLRRAAFVYAADNEWLLLLRSYGIVGLFYLLVTFTIPHLLNRKNVFNILSLVILISCSVYMIPAAIFHSLVLMPVVLILISVSEERVQLVNFRKKNIKNRGEVF